MNTPLVAWLMAHYQWQLSLYAGLGIVAVSLISKYVSLLHPTFREAHELNQAALRDRMAKPRYAANQAWNRKWSILYLLVIFGVILPFCLTLQATSWWVMLLDIVVILMVYDFVYYLVHRFLFHDGGFMGGPLIKIHAIHHQQHNPCRMDSSYIHPLEVAIGLGLYVATIFVLSRFMGNFHVLTIVITWTAFTQINLHNHDLWKEDRFPFQYLNTMSKMHHNHHARFTGGNFATITLLYDWMFGTLDYGKDGKARAKA
jgi:sterol desaturase/sphingolipid hydroxylase (fatty acid hydroxylase superfamily)